MDNSNIDKYRFIKCVDNAKMFIKEEDEFSLVARYLLSRLIYDNKVVENIDFSNLSWKIILENHSEWIKHNNVIKSDFDTIKSFLIKKTFQK